MTESGCKESRIHAAARPEWLQLSLTLWSLLPAPDRSAGNSSHSPSDTPIRLSSGRRAPATPPRLASSPEFPQRRLRVVEDDICSWSGLLIPEITSTLAGPESSGIMPWLRERGKDLPEFVCVCEQERSMRGRLCVSPRGVCPSLISSNRSLFWILRGWGNEW